MGKLTVGQDQIRLNWLIVTDGCVDLDGRAAAL